MLRKLLLALFAAALALGWQQPLSDSTLAQTPSFAPTRDVPLLQGWNLVGWTAGQGVGFVEIREATASIEGDFDSLFVWEQQFRSFSASVPFLSQIDGLAFVQGVWILANKDTVWRQGTFDHPVDHPLKAGFNLDIWGGPDGIPPELAFGDILGQLEIAFIWHPAAQSYLSYSPSRPAFLNDMPPLNFGDGVWVKVNGNVNWAQPAFSDASLVALSGRTALVETRPSPFDVIDHPPPLALLIDLEVVAGERSSVRVVGQPGSVPGSRLVSVASHGFGLGTEIISASDGSFATEISSWPGDTITVRYDSSAVDQLSFEGFHVDGTSYWPGTLLTVPGRPVAPLSFAVPSLSNVEGGIVYWSVAGDLSTRDLAAGDAFSVAGTLTVFPPDGGIAPTRINLQLGLIPAFDGAGAQLVQTASFVTTLLSPSGIPIEHEEAAVLQLGGLPVTLTPDDDVIRASFTLDALLPSDLPSGTYRPVLTAHPEGTNSPVAFVEAESFAAHTLGTEGAELPLLRVGEPHAPRLTPMLLVNSPSQGQRGVISREERGRVGFVNRIATASDRFVIEPREHVDGELRRYRLEPFLPLTSLTDRALSDIPSVPFDLPGGTLSVSVKEPSGALNVLGPAPIVQIRTGNGAIAGGDPLNNGGGNPGAVLQLTTLSDDFLYSFTEYGRYTITVSGSVPDIHGTLYRFDGTFDVWVAETLDIDFASLPGTPFEVGDTFPFVARVSPGVPAQIEWALEFHPLDGTTAVTQSVQTQASRFGYAGGGGESFTFSTAGEYAVTVNASYTDGDGRLWLATRRWGSGVASPDSPIIAHGRRGIDAQQESDRRAWFTRASTSVLEGGNHISFPYFTGDVVWTTNADSIQPRLSIEDTDGAIADLIAAAFNDSATEGGFAERSVAGALPLHLQNDSQLPLPILPDLIQEAYAYVAVERPGIRVRETIQTDRTKSPYWRFDDTYLLQQGVGPLGDLPNDLKWQFAATVFKRSDVAAADISIYGSLWVMIPDSDPLGSRVFPPFQGAAGGPSGGPILTLKGEEIDLFFLPTTVQAGAVLEVGDRFVFAGHVGPPLASKVTYTVTNPSGAVFGGNGQANAIGYYADSEGAFTVDEPGIWTVQVDVLHDGDTSAGLAEAPFPSGGVLGSDDGSYTFFVVDSNAPPLDSGLDAAFSIAAVSLRGGGVAPVHLFVDIPEGWTSIEATYVIRMPGYILETGDLTPVANGKIEVVYDPAALSDDFPNIDLTSRSGSDQGLADEIVIGVYLGGMDAGGADVHAAKLFTLVGEDIYDLN